MENGQQQLQEHEAVMPAKTHGLSRTAPEYRHWINMKSRCNTPSSTGYHLYGGRGIRVCKRWNESFRAFYEDMGPRPSPKHTVDRIDPNGDYEPSNCRWATYVEQGRNIRNNHVVKYKGERMTLAEAAEHAPVPYNTVLYRIKRGWPVSKAVELPPQRGIKP